MKYAWMDEYLMNKTGVTKDLKEEWNWIRYMIGGKMFAAICLDEANENKPVYITLKLEPLDGDFLRQQYEDIIPGYYMNKVHWNSVKPDGEVPDDLLMEMLDKSYALVLHSFSKKRQQEILLTTYCGLDCTNCEYKEPCNCNGCISTKGMAYDFKKDSKEFYRSKNKPEIVNVPKANYIAVRGSGDPNEEGGAYQQAISVLYAVAYTLKMSYKTNHKIEGFYEYVVPPLEGFWWQENVFGVDYSDKSTFHWVSVIRVPDFISQKDFDWAVKMATNKKKLNCSSAEFITIEEGLCVQIMHIGPFDEEPKSVAIMDEFLEINGYVNDMNARRLHHEIYLSDVRKVPADKWKTIIRHPIKKAE